MLGALFVLSFAASAFAIHAEIPSETQAVVAASQTQITLGGELRVRGWYYDNISSSLEPVKSDSAGWYDERVRLSLDAKVSPNVEGFVQLESNGGSAQGYPASTSTTDKYIWGQGLNTKPTDMSILQAWIMYSGSGLLGMPSGIKIGHMPLALGQMQFFDHTKFGDDAIVLFANPVKEMEVDLLTIKFAEENKLDNNDDIDGYVGIVTYKLDDKNTIGVNYTYLNSPEGGPFGPQFNPQDLSLTGSGNIAGLGWKFEGDLQFGKVTTDYDAKGYAVLAGLNYAIDPINIRASFAYGSGNKDNDDHKQFIVFNGADQHYTLVYDYNLVTAGGSAAGGLGSGIANTTYYNLGIDVKPVKDLALSLDGYILRASKDTFSPGGALVADSGLSKNVGWEVDGKLVYNIAKNLTYEADGGYMHAGSFYKDLSNDGFIGADVKNPVVLMHKLTLSF
jgi:Alginate export